jgi:outer membrane protein assembly factor BamE (lipoprotein component of BamABCDE complex)
MKKILLISLIAFLLIISSFTYYIKFSVRATTGKKNWQNTHKIKIGMDSSQVKLIMGEPILVYYPSSENNGTSFRYGNMPLESELPTIDFDSSGIVVGFLGDSLGNIRYFTK